MKRAGHLRAAAVATALGLSSPGVARAQVFRTAEVTNYLLDYTQHAHAFVDYAPNLPRFTEGTPWWTFKMLLMARRHAHALYLIGDDRCHIYPARIGVLGWGATAGIQF